MSCLPLMDSNSSSCMRVGVGAGPGVSGVAPCCTTSTHSLPMPRTAGEQNPMPADLVVYLRLYPANEILLKCQDLRSSLFIDVRRLQQLLVAPARGRLFGMVIERLHRAGVSGRAVGNHLVCGCVLVQCGEDAVGGWLAPGSHDNRRFNSVRHRRTCAAPRFSKIELVSPWRCGVRPKERDQPLSSA